MKVVEIFKSIEGEGIRAGRLSTFVRLAGCNLNCLYCDTQYARDESTATYKFMTIEEIIRECVDSGIKFVTITGGEPLIHAGIWELIDLLMEHDLYVNVETNGTVAIPDNYRYNVKVVFTMDWKCLGSGETEHMSIHRVNTLRSFDVLKFVVSDIMDLGEMISVLDTKKSNPFIYVSPVYGKIEPKEIVQFMLDHKLNDVVVQVQLHKIIWAPDMRGV